MPRSPRASSSGSGRGSSAKGVAAREVGPARAFALVDRLVFGDPVGLDRGAVLGLEVVEPRVVAAEDRGLERPFSRSEGLESVFLLQVLGDLQAPQRFDLPL